MFFYYLIREYYFLSKEEFEFYIKGCSIGRFSLKYKEFDAEEIKRIFAEEEQGPINN